MTQEGAREVQASEQVPEPAELARRLERHEHTIERQWRAIGDLGERMAKVEESVDRVASNVEQHRREAHQDSLALNETMRGISEQLGRKADRNGGNGHVRDRVSQLTGGARALAWFLGFLAAAGTATAAWWSNLAQALGIAGKAKGGP